MGCVQAQRVRVERPAELCKQARHPAERVLATWGPRLPRLLHYVGLGQDAAGRAIYREDCKGTRLHACTGGASLGVGQAHRHQPAHIERAAHEGKFGVF